MRKGVEFGVTVLHRVGEFARENPVTAIGISIILISACNSLIIATASLEEARMQSLEAIAVGVPNRVGIWDFWNGFQEGAKENTIGFGVGALLLVYDSLAKIRRR